MASNGPTPAALMKLAKREEPKPKYRDLKQYRAAILALRDKGFTWREVRDWFSSNGLNYSMGQIFNVAKKK